MVSSTTWNAEIVGFDSGNRCSFNWQAQHGHEKVEIAAMLTSSLARSARRADGNFGFSPKSRIDRECWPPRRNATANQEMGYGYV